MAIYIVIENGNAYPSAYLTYAVALAAVQEVWSDEVRQQGEDTCSEISLPEDPSGKTVLYVEKGIHIEILRLNVSG
jgi:hypothetical protein